MKKHNRGMTMVEILVAFVMMTLVMGISYSCIKFASNLTREAADLDRSNDSFQMTVANYFRDGSGYEADGASGMTYVFEGVNDDGSKNGPYSCTVKTGVVSFVKSGNIYQLTDDTSSDAGRKIYFFSTKGE